MADEQLCISVAVCNHKDYFCKRTGREIAFKRFAKLKIMLVQYNPGLSMVENMYNAILYSRATKITTIPNHVLDLAIDSLVPYVERQRWNRESKHQGILGIF